MQRAILIARDKDQGGKKMKSGFVSIVGKTNVGKSSIINSLVGEKVAAIANRPQTTRKAIKAIVNRPDSQIIFIDTDRKSVVQGKSVDLGGRRIIKKKKTKSKKKKKEKVKEKK